MKSFKCLYVVLIASLLASCTEYIFDLEPNSSVIGDDVFTSYTTAQASLFGAYAALGSSTFSGLYDPISSDLMGEDVMLVDGAESYGWFKSVYQMALSPGYSWVESPWAAGYSTIYVANDIIQNASRIEDATSLQIDRLIGEAKAIRAYSMLQLAHLYCDAFSVDSMAPGLVLTTRVVARDGGDKGRSTLADTYATIISDLKNAERIYNDQDSVDILDRTRLNVKAVQGLLARVYLDKEQWQNASDYAVAAADHSDLELYDGAYRANEALGGYGYSAPTVETIFSYDYTTSTGNTYESLASFYFPCWGYSSIRIPETFVNLFEDNDLRQHYFMNEDAKYYDDYKESYGDALKDSTTTMTIKFGHSYYSGFGAGDNIKMRLSEMYLIEAEAEARLGEDADARIALSKVQDNYISNSNKSDLTLIDEILLERRKELFGEGFRLNDIKRNQQTVEREAIDHWVAFKYVPGDKNYYKFIMPIPQSELDSNDALSSTDQNLGY